MGDFEQICGASSWEKTGLQNRGARDLKELENYRLTGVPEPRSNLQNLARLGHFSSNRVGDLFGPQIEGAHPLKAQSSESQDP